MKKIRKKDLDRKYGDKLVWYKDPRKYPYVRMTDGCMACHPSYKPFKQKGEIMIGKYVYPKEGDLYKILAFWIRDTDRAMPKEVVWYSERVGSSPHEAVRIV